MKDTAANAGTGAIHVGASEDLQVADPGEGTETKQMGTDQPIQRSSANAPAVLDHTLAIDASASADICGPQNARAQVGNALEDVLPSGQQIMLILVGLVASGKSTFAQALERHFPQFRRCSQDELGDRRSVEALARQSLREGLSVVIDRANFDESQRATWIRIAREVPGTVSWVIVFDTPYEVCAARLKNRTGHPTITTPELGLEVLERFQSLLRPPLPHEGYSRIMSVKPSDLPPTSEMSFEDVQSVLRRLQATPEIVQSNPHVQDRAYSGYGWRGGYNRGYRGDRGGYQPRGFSPRGAPAHRGDWIPRGGDQNGHRHEGPSNGTRGSGSVYSSSHGQMSSSGWREQSSAPRRSSGNHSSRSGRDASDSDRTERDWRR